MASTRKSTEPSRAKRPRRAPATTIEGQEQRLVDLAVSLAEKQLADGTASSQVMTHYLQLGSTREKLQQERLRNENDLLRKRIESMESAQNVEKLMSEALNAFRSYSPSSGETVEETFDD